MFFNKREKGMGSKELARISRAVTISEMIPASIDFETRKAIVRKYECRTLQASKEELHEEIRKLGAEPINIDIPTVKYAMGVHDNGSD